MSMMVAQSGTSRHAKRARKRLDRRLLTARRAAALARQFRERLGALADDPAVALAVERAAELTALAEAARGRALRGLPISLDDVVRTERLAAFAVRQLRLDHHGRREPAADLTAYLAGSDGTGGSSP